MVFNTLYGVLIKELQLQWVLFGKPRSKVEGRYSIQRKDRWVSFGELLITNFEPQKPSN